MMLKRSAFRTALSLAAMMLLALPFAASAQDETEEDPANPAFKLIILDGGESAEGVLHDTVTAQLYAFNGKAGDLVTVTMTQAEDSELDPYIVLLGPAGQLIAKDDDSGKTSLSAQITDAELEADGIYFVVASSFTYINGIIGLDPLPEEQPYTVTVTGNTGTEEDDLQYFTNPLVPGDELLGSLNADKPVFYFAHVAEAETAIDVAVRSANFDTLVMVFAPGGDRIAVNDDDTEGTNTDSAVRGVELVEAGKYLVFATDVAFPNAHDEDAMLEYKGGDFTISLNAAQ